MHNFAVDSEKCKFCALSQPAWDIIAMDEIYGLLTDKCKADMDMLSVYRDIVKAVGYKINDIETSVCYTELDLVISLTSV